VQPQAPVLPDQRDRHRHQRHRRHRRTEKGLKRLLRVDAAKPDKEGYNTACRCTSGSLPARNLPKYTAMDDVTLITRENFKEVLTKIGLYN
jgi:hypothetical protein